MTWCFMFLCFLSFILYGAMSICNLRRNKPLDAIVNFTYSVTTLITGILILILKSTDFFSFFAVAWGLSSLGLVYKAYKNSEYVFALIYTILAFFFFSTFASLCIVSTLV